MVYQDLQIAEVLFLQRLICDAFISDGVARFAKLRVQVVACRQDYFDSLVAVIVRLRSPDLKLIAHPLPIKTEEVPIVRISISLELSLVFVHSLRKQVPVFLGADMVRQEVLRYVAILVLEETRDYLYVARVCLQLMIQVALEAESEVQVVIKEVELFVLAYVVFLQVAADGRVAMFRELLELECSVHDNCHVDQKTEESTC